MLSKKKHTRVREKNWVFYTNVVEKKNYFGLDAEREIECQKEHSAVIFYYASKVKMEKQLL